METTDAPQPAPGDKPDIQIDGQSIKIGGDVVGRDKLESHSTQFEQPNQTVQQQINVAGNVIYQTAGPEIPTRLQHIAERALADFRQAVLDRKIDRAGAALRFFSEPEMAELDVPDLEPARRLFQLMAASQESDIVDLVQRAANRGWENECVAAYLMVYDRLYAALPDVLRRAKDYLPTEQVTQPRLLTELNRAIQTWSNIQELRWPLIKYRVPGEARPFAVDDADDEPRVLFGQSHDNQRAIFWPGHPLLSQLKKAHRPQLISSAAGYGRTAMSLALGKYGLAGGIYLALHVSAAPASTAIVTGYVRRYLDFMRAYPTRLRQLSQDDYRLLARLVCSGLDRDTAIAEIRAVQLTLNLEAAWRTVAEAELERLIGYVAAAASVAAINARDWPRAVVHLAQRLGFETDRVLLVIDARAADLERLQTELLPHLNDWADDSLFAFVFLPQNVFNQLAVSTDLPVPHHQLTWTPEDFRAMIRYRYYNLMGPHHHIEREFDSDEAFEVLLACSGQNPRRFMQLWRTCEAARGTERVFSADLVRAVCADFKPA